MHLAGDRGRREAGLTWFLVMQPSKEASEMKSSSSSNDSGDDGIPGCPA
jgi:hypothetical protein